MERPNNKKMPAPAAIDGGLSVGLIGAMTALTIGGYFLQAGEGSLLIAGLYAMIWLILLGFSLNKGQWLPLLTATAYWLVTSAIRLFLRDGDATGREVSGTVEGIAAFAARPLLPLASIHPDLPLLTMAALTLAALMGLIMILDRSKPRSQGLKDGSSDQSDWF